MALAIYDVQDNYTGNGATTDYPFDFKVSDISQLLIVVNDAFGLEIKRLNGTDTTYLAGCTCDPVNGGGVVSLKLALPSNYQIYLFQAADNPTQQSVFTNKHDFSLKRIEQAFDAVVIYLQRAFFLASRSLRLRDSEDTSLYDMQLPQGVAGIAKAVIPVFGPGGIAPLNQWPLLSLLGANMGPNIVGNYEVPQGVTGQIPFVGAAVMNTWIIQGQGGNQVLNAVPPIAPGNYLGQKLSVIVPHTATYQVTIPIAAGVVQNGPAVLIPGYSIDYEWMGPVQGWFEKGRNT